MFTLGPQSDADLLRVHSLRNTPISCTQVCARTCTHMRPHAHTPLCVSLLSKASHQGSTARALLWWLQPVLNSTVLAEGGLLVVGKDADNSANRFSALLPCKHAIHRSWGKAWARPVPPEIPVPSNQFGAIWFYPPRLQSSSDLVSLREQANLCVRNGIAGGEASGG